MEVIELIRKYLNKQTSLQEDEEVVKVFAGEKHADEVRSFMQHDWQSLLREDLTPDRSMTPLLHRVHHQIRINEGRRERTIAQRLLSGYRKIAAAVLAPLLLLTSLYTFFDGSFLGLFDSSDTQVTMTSPNGRFLNFSLPDGTTGVLNNGSSLSYQLPFQKNRSLSLEGEAYFEVKHDTRHPFVVKTSRVKVTVLGTRFGVKDYKEDESSEVMLSQGKVKCELEGRSKPVFLKPNERLSIQSDKAVLSNDNVSELLAWKDGLLVLRDESMSDVVTRLERWYNVDITIEDATIKSYVFRATFQDEPIEEVLSLLAKTSPIDFRVEKRKRLDNGSFEKKHIVIYRK